MIQDYQWYWLLGSLIFGIYAAYSEATRRGHAYISVRYKMRFHVFISSFLTFLFLLLLMLSMAAR